MEGIRLCPRCGVALTPTQLLEDSPVQVDVCHQCHGIWFDADELAAVMAAVQQPDAEVDRGLLSTLAERCALPPTVSYITCPVCAAHMARRNYGHRSGVVVDACQQHGTWLDGGELETLMAWASAGGHVLDEKVKAERRAEAEQREAARRKRLAEMAAGSDGWEVGGRVSHRRLGMSPFANAIGELISSFFSR